MAYEDIARGDTARNRGTHWDELFHQLDAPVRRVAATDTFCAYQPALEDAILPQTEGIVNAVRELAKY